MAPVEPHAFAIVRRRAQLVGALYYLGVCAIFVFRGDVSQ
jgi:hypothetical protein